MYTNPCGLWHAGRLPWSVLLVDVRDPHEFEREHVPGSTNVPLDRLGHRATTLTARAAGRRILLVDADDGRAERACECLRAQGVGRLEIVAGGVEAWRATKQPLARRRPDGVRQQARAVTGTLALATVLLALLSGPHWWLAASPALVLVVLEGTLDATLFGWAVERLPWNRDAPAGGGASGPRPLEDERPDESLGDALAPTEDPAPMRHAA